MLLSWLPGINIEDFLNSYTTSSFQGIQIDAKYPQPAFFEKYVPEQFKSFMNDTIKEWEALGVIQRSWELARQNPCEEIPTVVCL